MENGTAVQVLTDLAQIIIKLMGRPAVQRQLLAIGLVLIMTWILSRLFNAWLERRFPRQPAPPPAPEEEPALAEEVKGEEETVPVAATRGQRSAALALAIVRQVDYPAIALLLAYPALALFALFGWAGGLIAELITILWLFLAYRFLLGLLYATLVRQKVNYYRTRLLGPLFIIAILLMVLAMLTQLSTLAEAPLFAGEENSLTLGTLLLALFGFYFWWVLLQALQEILQAIATTRDQEEAGAVQASLIIGRYILIILGLFVLFRTLQLDTTTIAAITGGLSIGLGLALQDVIKNFLGGIILLFEGTIRPGDWVEVDGVEGEVESLRIRATTIRRVDAVRIIVPNQEWLTSRVTTFTHTARRGLVKVTIGVSYQSNLQQVRALLIETAQKHPDVLSDPAPFAALINFGDSSLEILVGAWVTDASTRGRVAGELRLMIWETFNVHGIEIPYPQQDIHIRTDMLLPEAQFQGQEAVGR